MAAKVNCSICGKLTDPTLDNCPHCGSPVEVGRPGSPAPISNAVETGGDSCPSCGSAVQDGDIVCVRCGVNLLTGHKVAQHHQDSPEPSTSKAPYLVGGLVAVLVVIIGALVFVVLRDPVQAARQKVRNGDMLGAIGMLQKHTDSNGDDAEAFAMLGRLYWQSQQYADASTAFETASRLDPGDEDLAFMSVLAAGKIPGAAGEGRQLSALKRMVENHPQNGQARKMLALAAGASGDTAASEANLASWEGLENNPPEADTYRGIVRAMEGDYQGADEALSSIAPLDEDARIAQGYLASLEGEPERATALLAEALAEPDAGDVEAASRLGLLYLTQGNFDKALPLLRPQQGGAAPENARFFYALCLQTAGLGDEALMEYDRILSGGGSFAADAAVQMAILYVERGQLELAEETLRKAKTYGTSARLYTVEGQVAAFRGDLASAQESYRKAVQEDQDYPAAHLEQGLAYVRRGALSEGVRELERYLELADETVSGGRVNEVDLLVTQLRQTLSNAQG